MSSHVIKDRVSIGKNTKNRKNIEKVKKIEKIEHLFFPFQMFSF
jgi:hypothetical protein